ncbi:MAG: tRNA pseudouridine(55) synthase TruB, partial [Micrococcales bacterium]|nr:tRNA pseudouridine(55) synthase TruB [Micrococcales bacterium]
MPSQQPPVVQEALSGVLVVDKPAGWTSHDVVARARRVLSTRKVGHGGTLDPMATGVLVLGVGRGTRLLTYFSHLDKVYSATIRLGLATSTDDAEGSVIEVAPPGRVVGLGRQALDDALAQLTGEILQVPSSVSAIKVNGRRAYARVRAGQSVELAARPVTVHRLEISASPSFGTIPTPASPSFGTIPTPASPSFGMNPESEPPPAPPPSAARPSFG